MKIKLALTTTVAVAAMFSAAARAADAADAADAGYDAGASRDDEILVNGQKLRSEASGGTKTDTPLVETPQSISVISSGDVARLGLQNLNQALRFVAGVTTEQRGADAEVYDQFTLRGFQVPLFLDGLRIYDSPFGYASTQIDVSRVDRYEIIKGPASTLYGQSSPGGLVAISSKLPLQQDFYGAVAGTYGNYDLYRVDADVGGRSGLFAYRLYGSANGADTQRTSGRRERQTVSGAVTVGGEGATSLTLLGAYSHDPYNGQYGVHPASGTLIPNPNGRVRTSFTGNEPGDRFKREQAGGTYIFRHQFGENWAFRASGRYQYVSSALGLYYINGFTAPPGNSVVTRASYATREKLNAWTYDNQLTGRFDTGLLEHSILIGADRQVLHASGVAAFGTATSIDIYNPVYGTSPTIRPGDVNAVPLPPGSTPGKNFGRLRQQSVYAQDQIALGNARLTLSGRHDWSRTTNGTDTKHDRKFTYRVGALYLFDMGLAPYASYSTSFQPQLQRVLNGAGGLPGIADPSLGKQYEFGVKYQPPGTEILLTAAWFHIDQTNVISSNPITFDNLQSGKVRSKGFEFEATAPLPYDFNARVAASRQKVRIVEDLNPDRIGSRPFNVAKGNLTAFLEWAPKSGPLDGFAIGGDVRYVGKSGAGIGIFTPVATPGGISSPAYTVFDALLRYDLGKASARLDGVTLQLNVANLFDKKYLTSCYLDFVGWCWYGNRRTVQGTAAFKF